ncbi:MAG: hypothetical protein IT457_12175 [Planctomycetes bacterium]|nr:hypothetical protein [Planctomycetota bacterium]
MKLTVLFVDDDQGYAKGFVEALESRFDLTYVRHPDVAIERLRNGRFDGLVLDIKMPMPTGGDRHVLKDGQFSGLFVLDQCQVLLAERTTFACILTNVHLQQINEKIVDFGIELPDGQLRVVSKGLTNRSVFPLELEGYMRLWRSKGASEPGGSGT